MASSDFVDVVVVGDGLVGLSCAWAAAARGFSTVVVGRRRPGVASVAAAGFLAPTIDPPRGAALRFALAAREGYRDVVRALEERTGHTVPLAFDGVLRVPATEREARSLAALVSSHALSGEAPRWLAPGDVGHLEPSLHAPLGALWHPHDGMVDNQRLLHALDAAAALGGVTRLAADAVRIEPVHPIVAVALDSRERLRARHVVVAAGAWAPLIPGLPRRLAVRPLRGQMMVLAGAPVARPIFGGGGYLVPRPHDGQVLVGSTSEAVGFVLGTTDEALAGFRRLAGQLVPALARADEVRTWSGFRPMTLDGLPVLGADPEHPALIYACGHSRNGVLLAPLTGAVVAALIAGEQVQHDLSPFAVERFGDGMAVRA